MVHKPGKVVAEMGCHKIYSVMPAERRKIHPVLTCVLGVALMMIYPCKPTPPDKFHESAVSQTPFCSTNGWINDIGSSSFSQVFLPLGQYYLLWMYMELTCLLR